MNLMRINRTFCSAIVEAIFFVTPAAAGFKEEKAASHRYLRRMCLLADSVGSVRVRTHLNS
jgi:hypothetical protein